MDPDRTQSGPIGFHRVAWLGMELADSRPAYHSAAETGIYRDQCVYFSLVVVVVAKGVQYLGLAQIWIAFNEFIYAPAKLPPAGKHVDLQRGLPDDRPAFGVPRYMRMFGFGQYAHTIILPRPGIRHFAFCIANFSLYIGIGIRLRRPNLNLYLNLNLNR